LQTHHLNMTRSLGGQVQAHTQLQGDRAEKAWHQSALDPPVGVATDSCVIFDAVD
jgi:hypothetical protein